ncbi:hypothetical protein [Nitrolancea hollandica]|uniref:Uncharacterized protein n=1 Tax=Nitrolancea hollandica Lb TaxID=1129897 RepID=I4EFY3_9BACT|nr:hypothetical protein [Nitrolancea hollandica]CCF83595.1 hypothetical protein NITHO_2500002 [Nitrolancea hollandica Lb]
MVKVSIIRRPRPEPLPVRAADGAGWHVLCPRCGRNRTVTREAIIGGHWLACPSCEASAEAGKE